MNSDPLSLFIFVFKLANGADGFDKFFWFSVLTSEVGGSTGGFGGPKMEF